MMSCIGQRLSKGARLGDFSVSIYRFFFKQTRWYGHPSCCPVTEQSETKRWCWHWETVKWQNTVVEKNHADPTVQRHQRAKRSRTLPPRQTPRKPRLGNLQISRFTFHDTHWHISAFAHHSDSSTEPPSRPPGRERWSDQQRSTIENMNPLFRIEPRNPTGWNDYLHDRRGFTRVEHVLRRFVGECCKGNTRPARDFGGLKRSNEIQMKRSRPSLQVISSDGELALPATFVLGHQATAVLASEPPRAHQAEWGFPLPPCKHEMQHRHDSTYRGRPATTNPSGRRPYTHIGIHRRPESWYLGTQKTAPAEQAAEYPPGCSISRRRLLRLSNSSSAPVLLQSPASSTPTWLILI